jgi:ankyrin repeat protein
VDARTQGGTALHTACAYGRTAIVKLLLDHGADPQARDKAGRRPSFFIRKGAEGTKQLLRKLLKEALKCGNANRKR